MISFRINGIAFTYVKTEPNIVSLEDFMLDAYDHACSVMQLRNLQPLNKIENKE